MWNYLYRVSLFPDFLLKPFYIEILIYEFLGA